MAIRIAIVEDEPATARHLRHLLQDIDPEIEVMTMLTSVKESVDWLGNEGCDLIFMDIQLNDGLSFEIFEKAAVEAPVIFVTAYHDYALQAFKANGIDYILKPFDENELSQALVKFKRLAGKSHSVASPDKIRDIAEHIQRMGGGYKSSFLVHFRDKLVPLRTDDIAWFYTSKEVVYAQTFDGRSYVIDFTLEQLQDELDPQKFFRANRQFIVQRKSIQEVNFYFNGRLLLKVNPGAEEKMLISKARTSDFKAWMNE